MSEEPLTPPLDQPPVQDAGVTESQHSHHLRRGLAGTVAVGLATLIAALPSPKRHEPVRETTPAPLVVPGNPTSTTALAEPAAEPATEIAHGSSTTGNTLLSESPFGSPERSPITREEIERIKNIKVPAEVREYLARNTLFMNLGYQQDPQRGSYCSGLAVRSSEKPDAPIIGAESAYHCIADLGYVTGSDGKNYIVIPTPLTGSTGNNYNDLQTAATFNRIIIPNNENGSTHDIAIYVAEGANAAEVYAAAQRDTVSPDSVRIGQNAVASGWPEYQPNNFTGNLQRQLLPMKVYSKDSSASITAANGDGIAKNYQKVIWTYMAADQEGARCSYGASGLIGVDWILTNDHHYIIDKFGDLSVFEDLTGNVPLYSTPPPAGAPDPDINNKAPAQGNVIVANCGFTTEQTPVGDGGTLVNVVQSASEIPGYTPPDQVIAEARADAEDPTFIKTSVNGYMSLTIPATSPDGQPTYLWFDSPMLFNSPINNATIVVAADAADPEHLTATYVNDADLMANTAIWPLAGSSQISLSTSTGAVQYVADPTGNTSGSFITTQAQKAFGGELQGNFNFATQQSYRIHTVNGSYTFTPNPPPVITPGLTPPKT
jgi:hypothetical protein